MVKRKAESSSEEKSPKKVKNAGIKSFMQAANLFSNNQPLHKSLDLSSGLITPQIKTSFSDSDVSVKSTKSKISKIKKKRKEVSQSGSSDSENESIKPQEVKNELNKVKKSIDAFTPKIIPKKEMFTEFTTETGTNSNSNDASNNHLDDDYSRLMKTIEEKVQKVRILQNIKFDPLKDPKQQLNEIYPNLKQKEIKKGLKLDDMDEVYLFRIPKNINPLDLLNIDIDIKEGNKVKIGGKKYIIQPTAKTPHPTLVLSNTSQILKFKKNIVMEKYVKPPKDPKLPPIENASVSFPNNLKNRHPLFGSNFEEKIQLDEEVEKKLETAIKNFFKKDKKIKRKKMKVELEEEKDKLIFTLLNTPTVQVKKEKKKLSLINSTMLPDMSKSSVFNHEISFIKQENSEENVIKEEKKKKKKKKEK